MSEAKTFVLTGCASGIGQHLADVLIARGHRVLATDINLKALEAHAQKQHWPFERALVAPLDVRDSAAWTKVLQEAVSAFGRLDVLMNIAGYLKPGWVHEVNADEVHRHFDINTKGVIFGTQAAARLMVPQQRGHIINFASMAALMPVTGLALYSATKYAVRGFSLAAARELRQYGIYVSVICPDAVRTPMFEMQKGYDEAVLMFSAPKPLSVGDIAHVVLERVLPQKPLEIFIPARRGWLCRFMDVFPRTAFLLGPLFEWRARAHQARLRRDEP